MMHQPNHASWLVFVMKISVIDNFPETAKSKITLYLGDITDRFVSSFPREVDDFIKSKYDILF